MGIASRGMVSNWAVSPPVCATGLFLIARGCLNGATPRGQPWTSTGMLPQGHNGLSAWRMAVLSTFRAPSLCRHVHRELLRSVLLDVTPIISATACHQRNYVERYSRCMLRRHLPQRVLPYISPPAAARQRLLSVR